VLSAEQKAKMPVITHRIARPHPVTGRKALYAVSGSSFGIVGMPDDEARDLLDELAAHSTAPRYQLRFRYGVGDIVVWDNAALLHSATLTDPTIRAPCGGSPCSRNRRRRWRRRCWRRPSRPGERRGRR
jgi:taurine dioxygenase